MATILSDNSFGTLASGLAAGDTTLSFTSGHGARFPTITGSDVCYVCILNSSNVLEEVIITAHTAGADTATITRAAGSTIAKVWTAGDRVEARISKTALSTYLGNYVLAAGHNLVGGLNDAKTTVASDTTPDIFATTVAGLIDYTGTATCTGFVAAPQAGAFRKLHCAGACLFTAGANLLIEGIPSGTTITLAADATVEVYAKTTTQFKMTYSLSGTFTVTGTGFTAGVSNTAAYKIENGVVTLTIPTISGTSNTTAFTITGLPAIILPISATNLNLTFAGTSGLDNAAACICYAQIQSTSSGILNIGKNSYGGAWTASGTKSFHTASVSYHLAF